MAGQGGNGAEGRAPTTLSEANGGPKSDPLVGHTIDGRYHIDSMIGEGGMGMVFRGTHTSLGKRLAIKVLRPEVSRSPEIVERFRQEAQSASNIGNQHIIDVYDFGVLQDGSTYFVMEFLDGQSLASAIEHGPVSAKRTLHIVRQLCSALGAAHGRGIVHRDIKPDNVQLVSRDGDVDFVKVLDFGIAKVAGSKTKLTQAGQVFGTPHYMSPEQCAGTSVDLRTDIYAVGVMMYEMVTGQVPFDADNMMGILTKHLYEKPPAPRELVPPKNVPAAIEAIILKCLQKKPEARYQSMAELLADVDLADQGQTPGAVVERLERNTRMSARPSDPADLSLSRSGITFGVGQPRIPTRSKWPLVLGTVAFFIVVAVGVKVAFVDGEGDTATTGGTLETKPAAVGPNEEPAGGDTAPSEQGAPAALNRVLVNSEPEGAQVLLDGAVVGTTPYELPPGDRDANLRLTLKLSGYADRTIVVGPKDTASTLVTLQRDAAPVRRRSTSTKEGPTASGSSGKDAKGTTGASPPPTASSILDQVPAPQAPTDSKEAPKPPKVAEPAPKKSVPAPAQGNTGTATHEASSKKKDGTRGGIRQPSSQVIGAWE